MGVSVSDFNGAFKQFAKAGDMENIFSNSKFPITDMVNQTIHSSLVFDKNGNRLSPKGIVISYDYFCRLYHENQTFYLEISKQTFRGIPILKSPEEKEVSLIY